MHQTPPGKYLSVSRQMVGKQMKRTNDRDRSGSKKEKTSTRRRGSSAFSRKKR
jgi:hypothetical protein